MEALYRFHNRAVDQVSDDFYRFLYGKINWDQRMLAIKGPRGSGKTTLMLQRIQYGLKLPADQALYVTADHHWFYGHTLYDTVEIFYTEGGRYIFIDEVHKYPGWSIELKNIYDGFPDLHIVFSASSALDIYRGEADLSRRVITYTLPGMSFREYLGMNRVGNWGKFELEHLVNNHQEISKSITEKAVVMPHFRRYLKTGYLPIANESSNAEVPLLLNQVINTVIDSDLAYSVGIDSSSSSKIKKLLGVIAESAPFKPNISSIARKLDVSRESVYLWLNTLEKAGMLNLLKRDGKGVSVLQKPDKVYLENTNLSYTLRENPDIGSVRETFLLNQLTNGKYDVTLPEFGDFFVEPYTIEAGGKNKTGKQITEAQNPVIASDDIETGYKNRIPLWLFGFLY
ncbi:MAG: ATP-binding protein [Balneolaceae bacterium]|nr:MAG: ATP-binding protein [Balneolaceae bacterium]